MKALSVDELAGIAEAHGIQYDAPPDEVGGGRRVVTTTLSRSISLPRDDAFNVFADPQAHIRYFEIIKDCTPLIPLEGPLAPNEYVVLEHVQEAELPPRLMVGKYRLEPPNRIIKEAVTDPFSGGEEMQDKKKGRVELDFEEINATTTRVTTRSVFETNDGPVFVRGFIDHVWLNFFERLLVETGEIRADQMLTSV